MTTTARVSVGLPVFNGTPFLAEALRSLREQTYEDLQIIVSDNASTDATEEICRAAAAEDPRITYVRNRRNFGFVHNFNQVFRLSNGEYFTWAAADDIRRPAFIAACVERLDDDPTLALVCPRATAIDEHGDRVRGSISPGPLVAEHAYEDYTNLDGPDAADDPDPVVRYRRLMRDLWYTVQLYGVVRADVLGRTGLHPTHHMGDHILLSELALHGRFGEVPDRLFLRRFHAGQVTNADGLRRRVALSHGRSDAASSLDLLRSYPRRLRLHADGIARAPLTPTEKRRCLALVASSGARWARHRLSRS